MASGDDTSTLWLPNSAMRGRAEVPATIRAGLEAVRGYLIPKYIEYREDGTRVGAMGAKDVQRIREGYACGECLAFFDQRFERCPSCSHLLQPNIDIIDYLPDHWKPSPSRTSEEILKDGAGMPRAEA